MTRAAEGGGGARPAPAALPPQNSARSTLPCLRIPSFALLVPAARRVACVGLFPAKWRLLHPHRDEPVTALRRADRGWRLPAAAGLCRRRGRCLPVTPSLGAAGALQPNRGRGDARQRWPGGVSGSDLAGSGRDGCKFPLFAGPGTWRSPLPSAVAALP